MSTRQDRWPWHLGAALFLVDNRAVGALAVLGFVLLPAMLIRRALGPDEMLYGSDMILQFYYLRGTVGRFLAQGTLPLWCSGNFGGHPLFATPHAAVLYPFTWLFAVMEPGAAWTLTVYLHLVLAGGFAYGWVRGGLRQSPLAALTGALVYMLSGFQLTHVFAGHITLICAYSWVPALLWRTERLLHAPTAKRVALLSGVSALLFASGYPMVYFLAALIVVTRLVYWVAVHRSEPIGLRCRRAALIGAACVLGLLLAGPQILPTLELVRHTQRASGTSYAFSTTYSLPPENLITFVAPGFLGTRSDSPYWGRWYIWEIYGFVGIAALTLAVVGLSSRVPGRGFWAVLAAAGICLALGRYGPFYEVFYHVVPGASLFRAPGRYLLLSTVGVVPLVGWGVEAMTGRTVVAPTRLRVIAAGALAVCLLLGGLAVIAHRGGQGESALWKGVMTHARDAPDSSFDRLRHDLPQFRAATYRQAEQSVTLAAVTSGVIGAVLLLRAVQTASGGWAAIGLVVLLTAELLVSNGRYLKGYPEERLGWPASLVRFLREHAETYRIASIADTRDMGRARLYGLQHVGGTEPMLLRRYAELINVTVGRAPDALVTIAKPPEPNRVLQMLGTRYWLVHAGREPPARLPRVGSFGTIRVHEDDRALPRAYFVRDARVIGNGTERLSFLTSPAFDPAAIVILESEPPRVREVPATQPREVPAMQPREVPAMQPREDPATRPREDPAPMKPPRAAVGRNARSAAEPVRILHQSDGAVGLSVDAPSDGYLVLAEAYYPGWRASVDGVAADIHRANHLVQAVRLTRGPHRVRFQYRPRYLGFGFLVSGIGLVGIGGLAWLVGWRRRTAGDRGGGAHRPSRS